MRSRASRPNLTSLAAIYASFRIRRNLRNFMRKSGVRRVGGTGSGDDAEDVRFLHDQQLFTIDLDLGARPFAEQDAVAGLDVERRDLAVFGLDTGAGGAALALLRLLHGGVGGVGGAL